MNTIQEILKPIQADFEEWYEKIYIEDYPVWLDMSIQDFYATCADFQIGVLLRYFREREGLVIEVRYFEYEKLWQWFIEKTVYKKNFKIKTRAPYEDFDTAFLEALEMVVSLVK